MPRAWLVAFLILTCSNGRSVGEIDYLKDIKPLLKHKCYSCHGALKQSGGLRLDTAASLVKGGQSGTAIDRADPPGSLIIQAVRGTAGFQMPPDGQGVPLTKDEVSTIESWIRAGAKAPPSETAEANPNEYWSHNLPQTYPLPEAGNGWAQTDVDRWVAAKHAALGLHPRPQAAPATWLRRVYVDLVGVPPTRTQLIDFRNRIQRLEESSSRQLAIQEAKKAVVEQLLASSQYGQRWGRHWMDIWRYSDWYGSRGGNEIRYGQRHIWRWRDWIVDSLNSDKGYDQMVREMLAADEIVTDDPSILPATGFLGRHWYKFDRNVWLFETVERTGEAFLGLKLRCCRCHDHKYDPVSQEEYYRFRAFFEPHDIRTDPISAGGKTQKDPKFGEIPLDGIPRVYDKDPDAKTYRFIRGDGRYPDKTKQLTPGVPMALKGNPLEIQPVSLATTSYYPALRKSYRDSLIEIAKRTIETAEREVVKANKRYESARNVLHNVEARMKTAASIRRDSNDAATKEPTDANVALADDFKKPKPDLWTTVNGDWKYENGRLVEKAVTSFATIVSKVVLPQDFYVRLTYRPLKPGSYRSIGFSFDYADKGNSQDVYTSTGDNAQSIQAFHRVAGKQTYPSAGIVRTKLDVEKIATIEAYVQGSSLRLLLNGEEKLKYVMPIARKPGKFAIWVHSGSAEFHEVVVKELVPTLESARRAAMTSRAAIAHAKMSVRIAKAELVCLLGRIEAEVAKYSGRDEDGKAAQQASLLERKLAVLKQESKVAKAILDLELLKNMTEKLQRQKVEVNKDDPINVAQQLKAAQDKVASAKIKLIELQRAAVQTSTKYQPLGETFPKTSTGRRTALANWIASEDNPRTARIAVNHIWGRHFGEPIVSTTDNFGLNGRQPKNLPLLDWLALKLISNNWKMKDLHREIVLSATYGMVSSSGPDESSQKNRAIDPKNDFLWKMKSRRMEAEVVRDSVLHLAGRLDLSLGGPELVETDGEKSMRRSMYFRNTPNEKMPFLEVFDVADPNGCYRRKESVVPHQALAMMNSGMTQDTARLIARNIGDLLTKERQTDNRERFIQVAVETILCRSPTLAEVTRCRDFLQGGELLETDLGKSSTKFAKGGTSNVSPSADQSHRLREELVHVLLLHNDFVTIR